MNIFSTSGRCWWAVRVTSLLVALFVVGCVNVDPDTGKTTPRGKQKHEFSVVQKHAKNLADGMPKMEVLILLGSPAETSDNGNQWVYLPERPAVLIPSRALHLKFENDVLVKHGYRPIVLGFAP